MEASTGLPGLDGVLQSLWAGDNVVWLIEDVGDYRPVVEPFVEHARRSGTRLVYFRFARHDALLGPDSGARVEVVDPNDGFERFVTHILEVIEQTGLGGMFVFDCLSDLAADWFSDRMLGNFFSIVCPYLYRLNTVAYFALIKHHHSFHATEPIGKTAQVMLEVFRSNQRLFVQPLRVWNRHSPTMYMLHSWDGDVFAPVTSSSVIAEVLRAAARPRLEFTFRRLGVWGRVVQQAQDMVDSLRAGRPVDGAAHDELFARLIRMMLTRDPRFERLATLHFDLPAVVEIVGRMIGTGMIGGKSLGMLLARAILTGSAPEWAERLESHDSFYVGSDVFYTYLVQNDCWWLRRLDTDFDSYLDRAAEARDRIRRGSFPRYIEEQFMEMLDYYGQSPLIVRSSSLLEDSYGHSFSGKYESIFLANQGEPEERLQAFLDAVRTVYASTMSDASLTYRQYRGVLQRDEQMALLVQRVSGEMHGRFFFPQAAGVGFSFNPFVWRQDIDPEAGVLRLVFGLGTRAVERTDDDYTRLVALNAPLKQPVGTSEEVADYAQRRADVLDLEANTLTSHEIDEITPFLPEWLRGLFLGGSRGTDGRAAADGPAPAILTFERLLAGTDFVPVMRELCRVLEAAYEYPVDIEFTTNFSSPADFRLNLVQCRPFPVKVEGEAGRVALPEHVPPERVIFETRGPIVGHSRDMLIDFLIYVVPSAYSALAMNDRYSVARLVGRLVHLIPDGSRTMLVGPGRWGSSMPSLGLPVSLGEIRKASVLCELAMMHEGLVPDVSLGTHFFNDIVELDMLYLAVVPGREGHVLNQDLLLERPDHLTRLAPDDGGWSQVIRVLEPARWREASSIVLNVDSLRQHAFCHWRRDG